MMACIAFTAARRIFLPSLPASMSSTKCSLADAPPWPSLHDSAAPLQCYVHIWLFIVLWTVTICVSTYTVCGTWAFLVSQRLGSLSLLRGMLLVPACMLLGVLAAFSASTPVGLVLGTLYEAGQFKMPTTIAMTWGVLLSLYMFLGSFSSSTLFL